MVLTEVKTEKVPGRISNVHIGYNATNGVNISKGILSFEYWRNKDLLRIKIPSKATASDVQELGMSSYGWRLRFLSDCRQAFFATDVQATAGSQYAMSPNGLSNMIEYFKVLVPIEDGTGTPLTRTYTITGGYALRNSARIENDQDAEYEYEGEAEYISYVDS